MRKRATRILAALMILSMVVVPFQSAIADDVPQATPVSAPDIITDQDVPAATPGEDDGGQEARLAAPNVHALLSATPVKVESIVPTNNGGDNFDVVVTIELEEGFERLTGESFTFMAFNYWWESNVTFLGVTMGATSLPLQIDTTPTPTLNNIVVEATGDFTVPAGGATLQLTLELDVEFLNGCWQSPAAYHIIAEFYGYTYLDGTYTNSVYASPDLTADIECPGETSPWVDWIGFDSTDAVLEVDAAIPVPMVPGQSFTISYDATKLAGPVEPFSLQMYNEQTDSMDTVGNVVSSNGVLTFTVTGSGGVGVYDGWVSARIPMTFIQTCQEGQSTVEIGELTFLAVNDPEDAQDDVSRTYYVDRIVCDADPVTKTGVWMTDKDDAKFIRWTIDSGDLLPSAQVWDDPDDYGETFLFVCDSIQIEEAEGTVVTMPYPNDCEQWNYLYFQLDTAPNSEVETVRAIITIDAYPIEEPESNSFINCAYAQSYGNDEFRAASATGLGGEACFELFPEDGGDFITKTVDKTEVTTGETVTYTVVAETTANGWSSVEVTDPIPAGVQIDASSITCTVEPAIFAATPCYELNDDGVGGKVLSARAIPAIEEDEEGYEDEVSDAVKITLTFKGVVTAPAGSTIINEACSIRGIREQMQPALLRETMGDPTIIGGGEICDDAETKVVAPPPTETPTPSPTPTTPATPGATPTTTVEPTATVGVTELPKTGSTGGNGSAFQFLAAALVASVAVAAIGIRVAETRR